MVNAFLIVVIISIPTAFLSCFLVLKGWSLMGDAISHAVLPGLILAYVLNIPIIIGAFFAGLMCSGVSGFISNNSRVKPDTVLGVIFSGMFGLGVVLYVKIDTDLHLDHILFGNNFLCSIFNYSASLQRFFDSFFRPNPSSSYRYFCKTPVLFTINFDFVHNCGNFISGRNYSIHRSIGSSWINSFFD